MSISNYILILFDLKDNNIESSEKIEKTKKEGCNIQFNFCVVSLMMFQFASFMLTS